MWGEGSREHIKTKYIVYVYEIVKKNENILKYIFSIILMSGILQNIRNLMKNKNVF